MRGKAAEERKVLMKNNVINNGSDRIGNINNVGSLFIRYVNSELLKFGMRSSYMHMMQPLMESESLTQLQLVELTGLKAPTISITLRNMEREGIVARVKNDSDRRETHVSLTDKGKDMYGKILETLGKAEEIMLKGVSDKELKAARAAADKMIANLLSEIGEEID